MKRRSFIAGLFAAPLIPVAAKASALMPEPVAALGDYEVGTWTATYGVGHYTKIGKMINCTIQLSAIGSGDGTARITGLPLIAKGD